MKDKDHERRKIDVVLDALEAGERPLVMWKSQQDEGGADVVPLREVK